MSTGTPYVVFAAGYPTAGDVAADYAAVESLYGDLGMSDALDALVLTRDEDGTTRVAKHRAPRRGDRAPGPALGLAAGVLVSLLPGGGLVGTITADIARAIGDLTDETLTEADLTELRGAIAESPDGLLIVAPSGCWQEVERTLSRASKVVHETLTVNEENLRRTVASVQ